MAPPFLFPTADGLSLLGFFGSVYLSISSRSLSIPAHVGRGDRNAPAPAAATLVKQEQQQQRHHEMRR